MLTEDRLTAIAKGTKSENLLFQYSAKVGWNTICVPFNLKATYGTAFDFMPLIFGSGYQSYAIYKYDEGTGTLTFSSSMTTLSKNVPLLVYAPNAPTGSEGILLSGADIKFDKTYSQAKNDVTFQGTYAPIAKGNMPDGSYGITNAGQIVNAGDNSSIKGYRAYLTGLPSGSAGARIMILDDESNTPTDIGLFKMAVPEAKDVYTLSGQRVQKARKGIYVINGKKIVIK